MMKKITQAAVPTSLTSKIDPMSPFAKKARQLGLDPHKTSRYEMVAVECDLPKDATPDQIIRAKYGFNPKELTPEELDKRLRNLGYIKVQQLYSNLLDMPLY